MTPTSPADFESSREVCQAIYRRWINGTAMAELSREFNTTRDKIMAIIRREIAQPKA